MYKILIVEDEFSSAEMLSFVLQQEGYQVVTAENGKEALDHLQTDGVALVLCDLMMPVMDGRELCRLMKSDPQLESIPIVIMTAAPEVSITHMFEEGCFYSSFMRKPLDLDLLTSTVRNLITTS
jgi:CheY-like chemotaxis protein